MKTLAEEVAEQGAHACIARNDTLGEEFIRISLEFFVKGQPWNRPVLTVSEGIPGIRVLGEMLVGSDQSKVVRLDFGYGWDYHSWYKFEGWSLAVKSEGEMISEQDIHETLEKLNITQMSFKKSPSHHGEVLFRFREGAFDKVRSALYDICSVLYLNN